MRSTHRGRFVRHYLEMVVAMFVSMGVLAAASAGAEALTGLELPASPEFAAIKMAFDMSLGMVVWMRYRGHGWAASNEMAASMMIPSVAVVGLLAAGVVVETGTLLAIQHVVMFPAMLAVMFLRLDEYTHAHAH